MYKSEHFPLHDLHLDQEIMYQDSTSKWWYPGTITRLCKEPGSYIVTTKEGVKSRKTQPQGKKSEDEHLLKSNHMQTFKNVHKKSHITDNLVQSRPKRDIKPPIKLDL